MERKRPWSDKELSLLRKLWLSDLTDYEIADRLNRGRGPLRRKAESVGMKPRLTAKRDAGLR